MDEILRNDSENLKQMSINVSRENFSELFGKLSKFSETVRKLT